MVEVVARHGFAGTTLHELVRLAGVSKTTFYEHFESKQDCFLSTFDEIVAPVSEQVGAAYLTPGDPRERLRSAVGTYIDLAVKNPAVASFALVESLALGAAGIAHRGRSSEAFALMIRQSFELSPPSREVSPATIRAIVAGVRGVIYRRFRDGQHERLPGYVDELIDWAFDYQNPDSEAVRRAMEAAAIPGEPEGAEDGAEQPPSWEEPPHSARSRAALDQRERIIRAAAQVAIERGFAALSIPAISGAAGVSNQTFYEHFTSKRDAFLAAFAVLAEQALARATTAFEAAGDRPEAIGTGLRAVLEHIAENPIFARLAFLELPTAGPVALDHAETVLDSFTAFLKQDILPNGIGGPPPDVVLEAIGNGVWFVIQHEIVQGRLETLPEMAPEITRIALAPFGSD